MPLSDDDLGRRLEDLHEIGRREDWEAFNPEIERIIAECANAAQLWRLAESDPFWESAFGEEGPTPEIVLAVLARVEEFEAPEDVALGLALAARMTAVHPGMQLLDDERVGRKMLDGVEKRLVAVARARLDHEDRGVRIAALHALGCAKRLGPADGARIARFAADPDDDVAATAVLSSKKAPARRRKKPPSLVIECLLVRHEAKAARKLGKAGATVLARAMREPVPLPAEWGWRWEAGRPAETSAHLALKIAAASRVARESVPVLVSALAEWAEREGDFDYLQDDLLLALTFGDRKAPDVGYTVDELTPEQKQALHALSRAKSSSHVPWWRLGLHQAANVAGFLAGTGAMWQPLEVQTKRGPRRWPLKRLWPETILGNVTEEEAARAIVENLPPAETFSAICGGPRGILLMMANAGRKRTEKDELRDTALVFRVVRGYRASGVDVKAILQALADHVRSHDRTTLGRAIACAFEGSEEGPRETAAEPLAWASAFSVRSSPVHALIEKLPAELRAAIEKHRSELGKPRGRKSASG